MTPNDIIKAWKNSTFRASLSAEERAGLPQNPAGLIELIDDELEVVGGGTKNSCTTACPSYKGMCCSIIVCGGD
ncbi:MAG: mersacidin/lichenicidin family type 2 lantibiotic [Polyangiaceae bacterium]|nr:mersacidin/lichenicidin family type 2 lantibiotic [Polyangiaceae bacterium]